MFPTINYIAVALALLSTLVVGTLWYSPKTFGTYWMRLTNVDPNAEGRSAVVPIVVTIVVSFLTAWVLAAATWIVWSYAGGGSFFVAALVTAVVLWAGFTAARFITHDAFEGRPPGLTVLNIAHELVTVVVMAIIIGVWPPAA